MTRLSVPVFVALLLAPAWPVPGLAATATKTADKSASAAADSSHFRLIDYRENEVVKLNGCLNFQTMIMLATNETVQNVGLGNSGAWQVTPNKRGNLLFVKPMVAEAFSNMSVVTDKRSYNFELRNASAANCTAGNVIYSLRFNYAPDPVTDAAPAGPVDPNAFLPVPEKRNTAYTYSGAAELVPVRVFDDGNSTYMRWPVGVATPAVYAVNSDGSENLVNYASRGDYFVVEQLARAFVLRLGEQKVTLYNDAFRVEGLDALSPKPRPKGGQ